MRGIGVAAAAVLAGFAGISHGDEPAKPKRVTFYGDVLPILQENCQKCHRPNGANLGGMVAPMALVTYEETRPWAKAIAKNVANRNMPPWHAAPEQHGQFENERTLTQEQIDTLVAWAKTGARRGNPDAGPEPIDWGDGGAWTIGKPDLVVAMPEKYFVEDEVEDQYVNFVTPITEEMLPEERYIKAVEFKPGSPAVHHIIAPPLGGIAPGNDPTVYPEGVGQRIAPGMAVQWQMHYHKEPGPDTGVYDQSKAGITFYSEDEEVEYELKGTPLGNFEFRIPPHTDDYSVQSEFTFDYDTQIVSMTPHMHLRGKSALYEAIYPDGSKEVLLEVPEYDFNWQTSYTFKDFKEVPAGTKVVFTSTWDNTADNPYNPDPSETVTFGRPTTAEMSFGFLSYIDESGEPNPMFGGDRRRDDDDDDGRDGFNISRLIKAMDANGDGKLQENEAPDRIAKFFSFIDSNGDGGITAEEAEAAFERFNNNRAGDGD